MKYVRTSVGMTFSNELLRLTYLPFYDFFVFLMNFNLLIVSQDDRICLGALISEITFLMETLSTLFPYKNNSSNAKYLSFYPIFSYSKLEENFDFEIVTTYHLELGALQ